MFCKTNSKILLYESAILNIMIYRGDFMKRKNIFEIVTTGIFTLSAIHAINRIIFHLSEKKDHLYTSNGRFYKHQHGKIFYTKTGKGSPLLLIHNLDQCGSDYEWHRTIKQFSKNHTVYTIDLLGCGRSDKPRITYTSYLYVQTIYDFIIDVIGTPIKAIVSGETVPIIMMLEHLHPNTFEQLIFINPVNFEYANLFPTKKEQRLKVLLDSPIIGTFIYNIRNRRTALLRRANRNLAHCSSAVKMSLVSRFYSACHRQGSNSKFLFNSKKCHYLGLNIINNYSTVTTPTCVLMGDEHEYFTDIADWDIFLNPDTEVAFVPKSNCYPQLEQPESFIDICETYFTEGTLEK